MSDNKKENSAVFVITNMASHYRKPLWIKMMENENFTFHFLFGDNRKFPIKEIQFSELEEQRFKKKLHRLKNRHLKNGLLVWQSHLIGKLISANIKAGIIAADAYVLSNWIAALILRLRRKQVVFWSHGLYGNESLLKKLLRSTFFKLATHHLLYERRAKQVMVENGFKPEIIDVVFNSLDYEKSIKLRKSTFTINKEKTLNFFENPEDFTLLFVGRLTKVKRLDLLVQAFNELCRRGKKVNLLVVGDGEIRQDLEDLVDSEAAKNRSYFYGACYDEEILAQLIASSDLCVSPGNIGLTAIHCLSYGTPIVTHNNLSNQMPEVGAISQGITGNYFQENDLDSLTLAIEDWMSKSVGRQKIREECFKVIDTYYNPTYQIKVIENMLNGESPLFTKF